MRRKIKGVFKGLFVFLIVYVVLCVCLYCMQDSLLYHPTQEKSSVAVLQENVSKGVEVTYTLDSGKEVYAWYLPAESAAQTIIFFHGNSYNIERFINRARYLVAKGYNVLMPEYEGFGGIQGKPSQAGLEAAGLAAISFLNKQGVQNKDIVLYGHSMGTYVALHTAAHVAPKEPVNAVLLEAPFVSLEAVAKTVVPFMPVSMLLKDKYPSHQMVANINTRLFVAHGLQDQVIPFENGLLIYQKALGPKQFYFSSKADHNSLPKYGFLKGANAWLKKTNTQ